MGFLSSLLRLRIIPLVIVSCGMLLFIKTYDIFRGGQELSNILIASTAIAETTEDDEGEEKEEEVEDEPETEESETSDEEDKSEEAADDEVSDDEEVVEGEENADDEGKSEEEIDAAEQSLDKDAKALGGYLANDKKEFSKIELNILQSLAERRRQLNKWEKEIQLKENMLDATEARIENKISEIKSLEERVKVVLEEYNKHENAKIKSLVKIYESMKPKDAARIFDDLEVPVLLMVVDKMAEKKVAPIFAKMNPAKAQLITMELAASRHLRDESTEAIKALSK